MLCMTIRVLHPGGFVLWFVLRLTYGRYTLIYVQEKEFHQIYIFDKFIKLTNILVH